MTAFLAASALATLVLAACGGKPSAATPGTGPSSAFSTVDTIAQQAIPADGVSAAVLVVTVRDARGEPVAGEHVAVAISGDHNGLRLDSRTTDATGTITAEITSTRAERKLVRVLAGADGQVQLGVSQILQFVPTAPSTLASSLTVEPQVPLAADGRTSAGIKVVVRDAHGNPIPGQLVEFDVTGTGNQLLQPEAPTTSTGLAFGALSAAGAGERTVRARLVDGLELGVPATVAFVDRPAVFGTARFIDTNRNGQCDRADRLIMTFDEAIEFNMPTSTAPTVFACAVAGDSFGTDAKVVRGPGDVDLSVVMGNGPTVRARGRFDPAQLGYNQASGVDLSPMLGGATIIGRRHGLAATPRRAADLVPDFCPAPWTGASPATALAAGDLDRDGDVDLVTGSAEGIVRTWTNTRTGAFAEPVVVASLGEGITALAIADLDGDGVPDLAFASRYALWMSRGAGTLLGPPTRVFDVGGAALLAAHLDRDGRLDLALTGADGRLWILYGGPGGVDRPTSFAVGHAAVALTAFDADLDGDLDLAVAASSDGVGIWLNDGPAGFALAASLPVQDARAMVAVDIDRDGAPDLLVGGARGGHVFRNARAAGWTRAEFAQGQRLDSLAALDFDADGDQDVLAGGASTSLWLNDGGVLTALATSVTATEVTAMATIDIDFDGDLDLIMLSAHAVPQLWCGSLAGVRGAAGFQLQATPVPAPSANDAVATDFDGDGDLDLVVAQVGRGVRVLFNDATGVLTDRGVVLGIADYSLAVAAGDVDGDGDIDIVVGNTIDAPERLYLNNGAGQFLESPQAIGRGHTTSVVLGDLDGDGDLDLVTGNLAIGAGSSRVLWNDGHGTFTDSGQTLPSIDVRAIVSGDLDGDGDLDLVLANASGPNWVLLNNGAGMLADSGQRLGSGRTSGLALADLDQDGDLDLFETIDAGGADLVWWNDGRGVFTDSGQRLGNHHSTSVRLFDFDGDGDQDAVVAVFDGPLVLWLNDGRGSYTAGPERIGVPAIALTALDVDRDGATDLVILCLDGCVRVLRNR